MNLLHISGMSLLLFFANPILMNSSNEDDAAADGGGWHSDSAGYSPPFIHHGIYSDGEGEFGLPPTIQGNFDSDNEDWFKRMIAQLNASDEIPDGSDGMASISPIVQPNGSNGSDVHGGINESNRMANSQPSGSASISYGATSGPSQMMQNTSPQSLTSAQPSDYYDPQQQQQQHLHNPAQQKSVPTHNWIDGTHLGVYATAGSTVANGLDTPEMSPKEQRWYSSGAYHGQQQLPQQLQRQMHSHQQQQQMQTHQQTQQQQPQPHNQHQHVEQQRLQNPGEVSYADNQLRDSHNNYPPGYGPQQPEMPTDDSFVMGAMHPTGKVLSTSKIAVRQRRLRAHQVELRELNRKPNRDHFVPQTEFAKTVQSLTGKVTERQETADQPQAGQPPTLMQLQDLFVHQQQQQRQAPQSQGKQQNGQKVIGIDHANASQLVPYDPMVDEASNNSSRPVSTGQPDKARIPTAATSAGAAKGDADEGREQRPSTSANSAHQQIAPATAPIRGGHTATTAALAKTAAAVVAQQANREGATAATAHQPNRKEASASAAAAVTVQQPQLTKMPATTAVKAPKPQRATMPAATDETAKQLKRKEAPTSTAPQPKRTKVPEEAAREKAVVPMAATQHSGGKEGPSRLPEVPVSGPIRIKYVTPLKGRTIILREQEAKTVAKAEFRDTIQKLTGNGSAPRNGHKYRPKHANQPKAPQITKRMDISSDDEDTLLPQHPMNNEVDGNAAAISFVADNDASHSPHKRSRHAQPKTVFEISDDDDDNDVGDDDWLSSDSSSEWEQMSPGRPCESIQMHGEGSSGFTQNAQHGGSEGSRRMIKTNIYPPTGSEDQPTYENNQSLAQQLQSVPMPKHPHGTVGAPSGGESANELEGQQQQSTGQHKQIPMKNMANGKK